LSTKNNNHNNNNTSNSNREFSIAIAKYPFHHSVHRIAHANSTPTAPNITAKQYFSRWYGFTTLKKQIELADDFRQKQIQSQTSSNSELNSNFNSLPKKEDLLHPT